MHALKFSLVLKDSVDFDIVPLQACQLLLGNPQISKNNIVHNSIANKYYFKYNGRKITLILMNATEILQDDLERAERRKTEPSRREWLFHMFQHFHLNLIFFYKMKILFVFCWKMSVLLLCFVLFQMMNVLLISDVTVPSSKSIFFNKMKILL